MTIGILGKKLGMTQLFQEDGTWVPVTVIQAGPCKVLQVKTREVSELPDEHRTAATNHGKKSGKNERPRRADGYYAVQLGFDDVPERNVNKPESGHAKKAGTTPKRFVRELRFDEKPELNAGDEVKAGVFNDIGWVDVTGTSKGHGFAGTIKRYGFARQSTTHGNSKSHRRLGGIGRTYSTMKGVPKGKKMPGHYGVEKVTVQSLKLVKVDEERNLLYVRGAVPGHRNSYVLVRKAAKRS
ncbi:MAG: 50S ribosomal protein L3 [Planctomycetes bacterium]|nr:50S ribosomal protein L3 [Planctomycetota bacterium]